MSRMFSGGRASVTHAVRLSSCRCTVWLSLFTMVEALARRILFPLKLRRALFEKRANPLVAVVGQIATNLFLNLVVESPGKFLLSTRKKCLLHRANGQRRTTSDFLRQRRHFRFELLRPDDTVDNP